MKITEAKVFSTLLAFFNKRFAELKEEIIEAFPIVPEYFSREELKGDRGQRGQRGFQGKPGIDGSNGVNGHDGETGSNGIQGLKGDDGESGSDGRPGTDGKDGLVGENGKDGIDGKDGKDGKDGSTGIQGPIGKSGLDGADGKTGKAGTNGIDAIGELGPAGKRGPKGNDGTNGSDGAPGKQGKTGRKGQDGIAGVNGKDGRDGKDIESRELDRITAQFNGFKNIINAQLASLGGGGSASILDNDDVVFNYPSELSQNDVLAFDASVNKFVAINIDDIVTAVEASVTTMYEKLIDNNPIHNKGANTYTYVGEASPGANTDLAVWRIKQISELSNGETNIIWANNQATFVQTWDDRTTYNYSVIP